MPYAPWWAFLIMLLLIPVAVIAFVLFHGNLPSRLIFFFCAGLMLNHWMLVWSYRLQNIIKKDMIHTRYHVAFLLSVNWITALIAGIIVYAMAYCLIRYVWTPYNKPGMGIIILVAFITVVLSQVVASGIPKLAVDAGLFIIYVLGILSWKYFLTYPTITGIPDHQIQSDALTSFGIVFSFCALWIPSTLAFGSFLLSYYRSQGSLGVQLQMTRYAVSVAWSLFGLALIVWEALSKLIMVRSKYFD